MHKKFFDEWNVVKKIIDQAPGVKYFNNREIWFLNLGENIGFEQNGKGDEFLRPVLIYKKFSRNLFLGVPLTSKIKTNKFYSSFSHKNKISTAILSQISLFDAKRLRYYYGRVSHQKFLIIKEKLIELIR